MRKLLTLALFAMLAGFGFGCSDNDDHDDHHDGWRREEIRRHDWEERRDRDHDYDHHDWDHDRDGDRDHR